MVENYPILEFDPDPDAILNPHLTLLKNPLPEKGVACFFQDVLSQLADEGRLVKIGELSSEIGRNPLYRLEWEGPPMLVFHPG
ncbi:MAG TPA: hypothetical protein VF355_02995, partial [Anaerolineaceae bacterium]